MIRKFLPKIHLKIIADQITIRIDMRINLVITIVMKTAKIKGMITVLIIIITNTNVINNGYNNQYKNNYYRSPYNNGNTQGPSIPYNNSNFQGQSNISNDKLCNRDCNWQELSSYIIQKGTDIQFFMVNNTNTTIVLEPGDLIIATLDVI